MNAKPRYRIEERSGDGDVLLVVDRAFGLELNKGSAEALMDFEVLAHPGRYGPHQPCRLVVVGPSHAFIEDGHTA